MRPGLKSLQSLLRRAIWQQAFGSLAAHRRYPTRFALPIYFSVVASTRLTAKIGIMAPHHSDTLHTTSQVILTKTLSTNTFGPLPLTQALLPNFLQAPAPRIGLISSRVGSIADNSSG